MQSPKQRVSAVLPAGLREASRCVWKYAHLSTFMCGLLTLQDKNVLAELAPFCKYDRNGLDVVIDFTTGSWCEKPKLKAMVQMTKSDDAQVRSMNCLSLARAACTHCSPMQGSIMRTTRAALAPFRPAIIALTACPFPPRLFVGHTFPGEAGGLPRPERALLRRERPRERGARRLRARPLHATGRGARFGLPGA